MSGRRWTKEEDEYLEENAGVLRVSTMARKLKRSKSSIRTRASLRGLYVSFDCSDKLTCMAIDDMFNLTIGTASTHWTKKGLKTRKYGNKRIVKHENLIKFLEEHQGLWTTIGTDTTIIMREPWYYDKRKRDMQGVKLDEKQDRWSKVEIARLKLLKEKGYSNAYIAEKMGRTLYAVKIKASKLKLCEK